MKKILVAEVNWLGDAILTTPVFKALKKKLPSSYLGVMAVERVRGVFDDNPYIDEVVIFDEKNKQKGFFQKLKFIKSLKKKNFDTVFFIHRSFTRILICFFAGIKERTGYKRLKSFLFLTRRISPPKEPVSRQERYLYLFERSGITIDDRMPEFFVPPQVSARVDSWLKPLCAKHSFIVGVNPSANWALKRWPQEYFSQLCDRLVKEFNCAVIFTGAGKEASVIEAVRRNMQERSYDFCGKTNLKELAALIKNTKVFISNDSGPAHLAGALGVKTLVIFGPTSEAVTSPKGKYVEIVRSDNAGCDIPCYKTDCKDNVCMSSIGVEKVYLSVKRMLVDEKKGS